ELAAARVRALTPEQILNRLDQRFRLLAGGLRTAAPPHQTLRATLDWSYDLLDERERAGFRRMSLFARGWTLQAAEIVGKGVDIDTSDVFDLLASLVDKSLVVANAEGSQERYTLLETIRDFAEYQLLQSGESASVRDRHCSWCLELARTHSWESSSGHE